VVVTTISLPLRSATELVGSAALSAAVIGSGIAATRLSDDVGVQLLVNAIATAFALFVIISVLGPRSGSHLNPVVSIVDAALGYRPWRDLVPYVVAQIVGCTVGAVLANLMFELPAVGISSTDRVTAGHLLAEVLATAGLIVVIFVLARTGRSQLAAPAVAAYIGGAYFFTSSTSFANPAITIGRMVSDSFAGIAPTSAPAFIAAQLAGAGIGYLAVRLLVPATTEQ